MLHSVVAGIISVTQSIAPAPPPAAYVEGQVLEQTQAADGLHWSYALESSGTRYTASSKEQIEVTKGIAVHFATRGKKLFLIDRGGLVHRMTWVEAPRR